MLNERHDRGSIDSELFLYYMKSIVSLIDFTTIQHGLLINPLWLTLWGHREYCTIPGAEDNNGCEYYSSPGPVEPDDNKQYSVLGEADTTPAANNSPYYLTLTNENGDCENSVCAS